MFFPATIINSAEGFSYQHMQHADYCTNLRPSHISPNHLCHSIEGKFHLLPYEIDLPTTIIENKDYFTCFKKTGCSVRVG